MNALKWISCITMATTLSGCASTALHASPAPRFAHGAIIAVAPFANYTTTPGAGSRGASMTTSLLLAHGLKSAHAMTMHQKDRLPLGRAPRPAAWLAEARAMGARYVVEGAVQEWRYTIGLDGQPAVAVTVDLISAKSGRVLWTATGSRSGSPRESVGVLAEDTLNAIVRRLLS
ncbi:MAG: penicillin-binding protein activator LpoB [Acidiferrobacter sp.]